MKYGTWSKDGKTWLFCGFGIPASTCSCNGCRWEYGDPEMARYSTHEEATKDHSDESKITIEAFCGWGAGFDVGINVYNQIDGNLIISHCADLAIESARELAQTLQKNESVAQMFRSLTDTERLLLIQQLLDSAAEAESLEKLCEDHDKVVP